MTAPPDPAAARRRALLAAALGVAVLGFVRLRASLPAWVDLHRWLEAQGVPGALRRLDGSLLLVGAALLGARLAAAPDDAGRRSALGLLGLRHGFAAAWPLAALCALPMAAAGALAGGPPRLSEDLLPGAVLAPLVEETFFRGLLVAVLVRAGRLPFVPVALASALLFGASHVPWDASPGLGALPTVLVTGAGGAWFAWLALAHGGSLWVPIAFHACMNGVWILFAAAPDAVGGWLPNVGRALTIVLGTLLTLRRVRRERAPAPEPAQAGGR